MKNVANDYNRNTDLMQDKTSYQARSLQLKETMRSDSYESKFKRKEKNFHYQWCNVTNRLLVQNIMKLNTKLE